jgi:hypothetical protein
VFLPHSCGTEESVKVNKFRRANTVGQESAVALFTAVPSFALAALMTGPRTPKLISSGTGS